MDDSADKVDLGTMLAGQLAQRDKREAEGIDIVTRAVKSLKTAGFDSGEIARLLRLVIREMEGRLFVD
jgi:hypothetical protein